MTKINIENKGIRNNPLYKRWFWLTFAIFFATYFLVFLVGDKNLLIFVACVAFIWSFALNLVIYGSEKLAFTFRNMLFAFVALVTAPLALLIIGKVYGLFLNGDLSNLIEIPSVFLMFFILQTLPLCLVTLGGFIIGFLLSLFIGRFIRPSGR